MAAKRLPGWRFALIRRLIRKLIHLLPGSREMRIRQVWRSRRLWRFQIRRLGLWLSASKSASRYLSDDAIYWVDPKKIVFAMNSAGFGQATLPQKDRKNREFNVYKRMGTVTDGDWDKLERRFSELDFYRSYEERALKGTSWEQLPYYKRVLEQIENGNEKWGCRSKQDLDERCRMLDRIFDDIKQNGYKSREMQSRELGKIIGKKLSKAKGHTTFIMPKRGVSLYAKRGGPFYDLSTERAFLDGLETNLSDRIKLIELDTDINSELFARTAADELIRYMKIS